MSCDLCHSYYNLNKIALSHRQESPCELWSDKAVLENMFERYIVTNKKTCLHDAVRNEALLKINVYINNVPGTTLTYLAARLTQVAYAFEWGKLVKCILIGENFQLNSFSKHYRNIHFGNRHYRSRHFRSRHSSTYPYVYEKMSPVRTRRPIWGYSICLENFHQKIE